MTPLGYVAVGAAVLLAGGGVIALTQDDDNSNRDDSYAGGTESSDLPETYGDDLGCFLTARGIALIATGLNHGHSTTAIRASAAITKPACKQVVATFVNQPDLSVDVNVETPTGAATPSTLTGYQLQQAAAAPPPSTNTGGLLACFDWDSPVLERLCLDGSLDPPY